MKILIEGIAIIPMDQGTAQSRYIADADVIIEDGRISSILINSDEAANRRNLQKEQGGFDTVISGKNKLMLPGLINAHTHCGMSMLRNYADDLALEDWLFKKIFPAEDKLTADDVYWATQASIAEMLLSGTTCFADMYYFMDSVAQAVSETGIRASLSRGLQCFSDSFVRAEDVRLNEAVQLYKDWHGKADGRIRVAMGPHSVYTCTPDYLGACAEIAAEYGTEVHIHLLETATEKAESLSKFGKTSIEHCLERGVFRQPVMAAHSVHVTDEDIAIYARHGANALHCPGSNLKLGSGIAPVSKFMAAGVNICLGTDSAASNNNLDMFEEIRLAATLHKGCHQDPVLVDAYTAIKMATVNGAAALGFGDTVGSIREGNRADVILLDIDKFHYYPRHDMISAVAYSSNSADVDTVIVNGQILMKNRELLTIDMEKVKFMLNKSFERIF